MRQKRKRKVIKKPPKRKYIQKPERKESFWSGYSIGIIVFSVVLLMFVLLNNSSSSQNYDKETVGNIVSHESKYNMTQGRTGGSVSYYLVIHFQYMVEDKHFSNKVSLGYTRENIPFIQKIKDYGSMYPVKVTYDSHNPQISTIIVE